MNILEFKCKEFSGKGAFSDQEHQNIKESLSEFYNDYNRYKDNINFVVSCINLIIKDLKIPITYKFIKLLKTAENNETMHDAYELNQRDHVLHSLNLFTLGALIIYRKKQIQKYYLGTESVNEQIRKWAFCSLFHDIGYVECIDEKIRLETDKEFQTIICKTLTQLICAYGNDALPIHDVTDAEADMREDLLVITENVKSFIREFKTFGERQTNHGLVSSTILFLCKDISNIVRNPQMKKNFQIPYPQTDLWAYSEYPIEAIAAHTAKMEVNSDIKTRNPWIDFLYMMDEIVAYDRPYLKSRNRETLSIELINVEEPSFFATVSVKST
jgi:hypothetical protein